MQVNGGEGGGEWKDDDRNLNTNQGHVICVTHELLDTHVHV